MAEPTPPPLVAGAFEFANNVKTDQFNLKPLNNRAGPIPEDQRKISREVYEARNILKLLEEQGAFAKDRTAYEEFIARVVQAGETGCTGPNVDTNLAASALEQIRTDIVRRKGRHITYQYLCLLALCALGGAVVGELINLAAIYFLPGLMGYGWVIIGSMVGAWISVAATRREISFDGIPDFLNYGYEPFIRMLFVGVLASVFALFLDQKLLSVTIGSVDLTQFTEKIGVALVLGLVAGIGEKALSVQVIERARKVLAPASS